MVGAVGDSRIIFIVHSGPIETVACVGSSTTASKGTYRWIAELESRPQNSRFRFVNLGVGGDLSGGQRRRLQLMLTLLSEPNVLLLDEPTNDVDTEMLTAMEDLLDSWAGTLIVVSHDRYLLERVTDQQYAILDGRLRHLPGGIDEYLRLATRRTAATAAAAAKPAPALPQAMSGAQRRAAEKELAALDRQLARLAGRVKDKHNELAQHDQSDHVGITRLTGELRAVEDEVAATESRWLELSETLE